MRILIVLCVFFAACQKPAKHYVRTPESIAKEAAANQVLRSVSQRARQELGLRAGSDMGQMMFKVQKLGLGFYSNNPLTLEESRILLVRLVDIMLEEMNTNEAIRPFLGQYPMRPWNTEMTVFFRQPDGKDVPAGQLLVVHAEDGRLTYTIRDQDDRQKRIYTESYDEAVARIKDPSLPLVKQRPAHGRPADLCITFTDADGRVYSIEGQGTAR